MIREEQQQEQLEQSEGSSTPGDGGKGLQVRQHSTRLLLLSNPFTTIDTRSYLTCRAQPHAVSADSRYCCGYQCHSLSSEVLHCVQEQAANDCTHYVPPLPHNLVHELRHCHCSSPAGYRPAVPGFPPRHDHSFINFVSRCFISISCKQQVT
jgi:hypothetical protein